MVRKIKLLPAFEVAITMVFRALTLVPRASVNIPSSRIWRNKSWTGLVAFQTHQRVVRSMGVLEACWGGLRLLSVADKSF